MPPRIAPPASVGQAPPHSIEAEQSVLGALLLSSEVHYHYVIEVGLRAEDFYREKHRLIYESIQALFDESEPIDVVTVTEHLKSRGKLDLVGGGTEIDALTAAVPAVGNLRRYAQIVHDQSLLRRVLHATYDIRFTGSNNRPWPDKFARTPRRPCWKAPDKTARRTSAAPAPCRQHRRRSCMSPPPTAAS